LKLDEVGIDKETNSVFLAFTPQFFERWVELVESVGPAVDQVAIADKEIWGKFHEAMKAVGKTYDVKAITPLICKFIELADGLQTDGEWVSIVDIYGARVPKAVAAVLKQAVDMAIEKGDVKERNKWQILEYMAADYLSGSDDKRQ